MKKPIYKKWWFWIALILVIGWIGSLGDDKEPTLADPEPSAKTVTAAANETEKSTATPSEEEIKATEDDAAKKAAEKKAKEEADAKKAAEAEAKEKEDSVPREHKSALKTAEMYAKTMHMSKAGIYNQLTSEYGENFPKEAAQYAIDNIVVDWKENALKTAQTYAETMSMSDASIYEQLTSEYGEKFTAEEAQYAIDNLE